MGTCLSQEPDVDFDGPVDFNHFQILRAIGKGAFGKVCIVKKRDTKQMYALKYMNKVQMIHKHAVENVFREIKILRFLEHPFLVNLWFTFHDREDIFMVLDLMLGGDINYHLEKAGKFTVQRVRLYLAELALVLEYLRSRRIIHRDIKPANMLLDSQGHVHLTDFNVATVVRPHHATTSITGTKPYMAPEVVQSSTRGYSYAVDWWGLGVSAYEMLRGHRPFSIDKNMSSSAMHTLLTRTRPSASASWDKHTCDILKMLLHPEEDRRLQATDSMRAHPFFQDLNWDDVEQKKITPTFIPAQNRINCDPTHELEEMIVEPNPLHKKQHRLSKRNQRTENELVEKELAKINEKFKEYNRQKENEKKNAPETLEDSTAKRSLEGSCENAGQNESGDQREAPLEGSVHSASKASRSSREVGVQVEDECLGVSEAAWNEAGVAGEKSVADEGKGNAVKEGVSGEDREVVISVVEVEEEEGGSTSRVEVKNSAAEDVMRESGAGGMEGESGAVGGMEGESGAVKGDEEKETRESVASSEDRENKESDDTGENCAGGEETASGRGGEETASGRGGEETASGRGGEETASARGGEETASGRGGEETASGRGEEKRSGAGGEEMASSSGGEETASGRGEEKGSGAGGEEMASSSGGEERESGAGGEKINNRENGVGSDEIGTGPTTASNESVVAQPSL